MSLRDRIAGVFYEDPASDRIVPRGGVGTWLVLLATAAMGFLAAFALAIAAMALETGQNWQTELAGTATLQILSQGDARERDTETALEVLATIPGIKEARVISDLEQRALLEPWFGRDLPLEALPLPRLIAITATSEGYDMTTLRLRLAGELPNSRLDAHDRWRAPLERARARLTSIVVMALSLIALTEIAITTLAVRAALATQTRVIDVLRLVGARDRWIARAFVRRITRRAALGAILGTGLAAALLASFPATGAEGLPSLRPGMTLWLLFPVLPLLAALTAFATCHDSALRMLKGRP